MPTVSAISSSTAAAGYKRIVVGAGHLAKDLADYEQTGDDGVVYLDEEDVGLRHAHDAGSPPCCSRDAATCTASTDGELPELPGGCHSDTHAAPGVVMRRDR